MGVKINHGDADFPFEQLAEIIRGRIRSGEYAPGSKLPTIAKITEESGLAPMTIRRAMAELSKEGLVRIVPGRGTFVKKEQG